MGWASTVWGSILSALLLFPLSATAQNPYSRTDHDTGQNPGHVTVGDFDGDERSDIAVSSAADGTVTLLLNDGTGAFSEATSSPLTADDPRGLAAKDLDGNGTVDLAVAGDGITFFLNDGSLGFTSSAPVSSGGHDVGAADFDGDGDIDLVVSTRTEGMKAFANRGGDFVLTDTGNPNGFEHQDLTLGRFNEDDRLDVAVAITGDDGAGVLLNTSPTTSDPDSVTFSMSTVPVQNAPRDLAAADWDQDGSVDLAVGNSQPPDSVSILSNDGTGSFTETDTVSPGPPPEGVGCECPWGIAAGDFDNKDGPDLALADNAAGDVTFLLNDGSGQFGSFADDQEVGSKPEGLVTGSFNEDGVTDVVTANIAADSASVLTSTAALPVELSGLEATLSGGQSVRISWKTASETNNAGFEVQRQKEEGWTQVGFVDSKASGGTTTETKSYSYTAGDLPVGTHKFRLKQVDLDGSSTVTAPVTVDIRMQEAVKLTAPVPNPTSSNATVSFAVKEQSETTIRLYNTLGQQVATVYEGTPQAGEEQAARVDVSDLPSGTYFLRLETGGKTATQQVTVVR